MGCTVTTDRSNATAVRYQLVDEHGQIIGIVSGFLQHLSNAEYSPNTVRAYAYDLRHFFNFLQSQNLAWTRFRAKHGIELLGYLRWVPVQRGGARRAGVAAVIVNDALEHGWNREAERHQSLAQRCVDLLTGLGKTLDNDNVTDDSRPTDS